MNTNKKNSKRETWKPVRGFEGLYEVSSLGRVRSLDYRGTGEIRMLSASLNKKTGYLNIALYKDNMQHLKYIHRLVAEAFIPNPKNLPQVDHRDSNRARNCVSNLRWVSRQFNNSRPHARMLKRLSRKGKSKLHLVVRAEKDGETRYFRNARQAALGLGFSHVMSIKVLGGEFTNAHGWRLTYIDRNSEEARNCGVEFRSRSEMGINPSRLRKIENKKDRKRMKEERQLKFQQMKVELLLDYHSRQIGVQQARDALRKLAHDFKAIVQKTLDGKFVREWKNTYTAQVALGIRDLYDAVRTGEPAGNYKWEWKIN